MSITDGQQALIRRIVTMTTEAGIVLPEAPQGASLPRYVVQEAGGTQRSQTLDGLVESRPEIVVRVEVGQGNYTTESNALIAALSSRFKPGDEFDGIQITQPIDVRPPLPANQGIYSVPVIIRGLYCYQA